MKDAKKYAEILLERGVSYDEILAEPSLQGVSRANLRTWKSRLKEGATQPAETATKKADATQVATLETETQRGEAMTETPPQPIENAPERAVLAVFIKEALQNFHPADALYFGAILIACNGIANALQGVGVYVAGFYFAVAFVALQGVKTTAGAWRWLHVAALLLVEVFVGGAAHFAWANGALWENVEALPFDIHLADFWSADANKMRQEWIGSQREWVGNTAIGVAAFLVSSGFYACLIALKKK